MNKKIKTFSFIDEIIYRSNSLELLIGVPKECSHVATTYGYKAKCLQGLVLSRSLQLLPPH